MQCACWAVHTWLLSVKQVVAIEREAFIQNNSSTFGTCESDLYREVATVCIKTGFTVPHGKPDERLDRM